MSTLADELLQDFEESGSEAGHEQPNECLFGESVAKPSANGDVEMGEAHGSCEGEDQDMSSGDVQESAKIATEDPEVTKARVEKMQLKGVRDVRSVASLMKILRPVLEKIAFFQSQPAQATDVGNIEDHPEYHGLTQSNSLSTQIDSEIVLVHKFIRDHYSVRFPELETLVTNPIQYAQAVAILGNGPMNAASIKSIASSKNNPIGATLGSVLDGPSLMIVTMEATITKGQEISPQELERIVDACNMIISLDQAKATLTGYVQSRMNIFAPNLTTLIGSLTAAQLLNAAGGLSGLVKTPACNLPAWGSKKQHNAALASNIGFRQQGFIFQSDTLREVPNDVKKQAMKKFANKIVMCARMDCFHQSRDGSEGKRLRDETLDNLARLHQKPLNKSQRALPAPDDKPSRKRGGRRARKAKEATAMTDLAKQQNRMAFGKEEQEVGYGVADSTKGMGMIGQRDSGRLRATQIDQRTRARLSAKSKGWGGTSSLHAGGAASSLRALGAAAADNVSLGLSKGLRTSGVGTTVGSTGRLAGTVSSLAFTPMQGLELVDPKLQSVLKQKRDADEDRWFKGGTFTQLGGTSTTTNGGGTMDGVFKKPALPPPKRLDTGASKGR